MEEKEYVEKIRLVSSVIVMALAGYGLITDNFEFMPYMLLFLGVFLLVTGVFELQTKRKTSAIFTILTAQFYFMLRFILFKLIDQNTNKREEFYKCQLARIVTRNGVGNKP